LVARSLTTVLPASPRRFEQPLDLLLEEVRRQRVAIENIAMAPIVSRYLEYMRVAAERDFNLDIEWLHMAATLIHWKSEWLLPREPGAAPGADSVRDDLIRRLTVHRKEVAGELGRLRTEEGTRVARPAAPEFRDRDAGESAELPFLSVADLIEQARDLARWVGPYREERRLREAFGVEPDEVTVEEMIDYVNARFAAEGPVLDGGALLEGQRPASRRACLFLGMLEMACRGQAELVQTEAFGPLHLTQPIP
jgi:chromatin segregation and condensation protein Rec8/ScpA/Scc1 (kleisin family)